MHIYTYKYMHIQYILYIYIYTVYTLVKICTVCAKNLGYCGNEGTAKGSGMVTCKTTTKFHIKQVFERDLN